MKIKLQAKNAEISIKEKNKEKVISQLHDKEEKLGKAIRKLKQIKQKEAEDLLSQISMQIIENSTSMCCKSCNTHIKVDKFMDHIEECSTANSLTNSVRQSLKENDRYFRLENPEMSMSLQNLHTFGGHLNFSSGKKLNPVSEYDEQDPQFLDES